MGYRGMGHMGNGVQRYGTHGQLGTGVWGTCMGNEVQGYGTHGQWGTGVWGTGVWGTGV